MYCTLYNTYNISIWKYVLYSNIIEISRGDSAFDMYFSIMIIICFHKLAESQRDGGREKLLVVTKFSNIHPNLITINIIISIHLKDTLRFPFCCSSSSLELTQTVSWTDAHTHFWTTSKVFESKLNQTFSRRKIIRKKHTCTHVTHSLFP